MKIFGCPINQHDPNTYDGKLHYQKERYCRIKRGEYSGDKQDWYFDQVVPNFKDKSQIFSLSFTGGGFYNKLRRNEEKILKYSLYPEEHPKEGPLACYYQTIKEFDPANLWDYYHHDNFFYSNHHQTHAIYAYLQSGYPESDILVTDGGGWKFNAVFFGKDGSVTNLSDVMPLGWLWNVSCKLSNFKGSEAGKLMGLSAYGEVDEYFYEVLELHITERMRRKEKFYDVRGVVAEPRIVAATMQQFTLDKVMEHVIPLKTCDNLCVAGGVAYNGYMNELFTKHWKNVFVPTAPGDEGQALGCYMHADYIINNNIHVPDIYAGQEYDIDQSEPDYHEIAKQIANGKIIGWYQGKSESGYRALGNRSILADPRNPNIKDIINSHIKLREDYRPFAPSVLEEYYQDYFDTNQPSPHMSRIVPVISDDIPGVTHIDGTARIQTVTKRQNERYYKLISAFYDITGIPMLLNTSFNCQEPIVETPEDAMKTFENCGLNTLVIGGKMICK